MHRGFGRIGPCYVGRERSAFGIGFHVARLVLRPELLGCAVDHRQIVIVALHRPDLVAVFAECLTGIGAHAGIDHHRHIVEGQDKGAHIVVVVTLVVESALGRQKGIAAAHIAKLGLRVPGEVGESELPGFLFE